MACVINSSNFDQNQATVSVGSTSKHIPKDHRTRKSQNVCKLRRKNHHNYGSHCFFPSIGTIESFVVQMQPQDAEMNFLYLPVIITLRLFDEDI